MNTLTFSSIKKNPGVLLDLSRKLVDYLIATTRDQSVLGEYLDLSTGRNFGKAMINDFGDSLPFVYWLGDLSSQPSYQRWAMTKADYILRHFQASHGLFFTSADSRSRYHPSFVSVFDADDLSDTILGINLLYQLSNNTAYLQPSVRFFEGFQRYLVSSRGYVFFKVVVPPGLPVPFSTGKFAGLYIEELLQLYFFTKDQRYLALAKRLAMPWLQLPFFQKYGLFPFVCTSKLLQPLLEPVFAARTGFRFDTAMMTKSNTNLVSALIRLSSVAPDPRISTALNHWKTAVGEKLLTPQHTLTAIWSPHKTYNVNYCGSDHAVIDCLTEMFVRGGDRSALALAETIAQGWMATISEKGLISEVVSDYDTGSLHPRMLNPAMGKRGISRLDTHTDFGVVLLKLYETTRNEHYLKAVFTLLQGVLQSHRFCQGYAEYVNIATGEPISLVIETKMLFLLTKFFNLFYSTLRGEHILKNRLLQDITRDR